ncbi:preprotein translocase subunit SecG [Methylocaldum szegediense]|jgi:preprotein translocase subunit SecG|uniref:Protein-export membrane protein SecG n=1 Tax=Methylocaldum szegediense TaxID=73780 RepID=A0ABN8X9A1_9GAMM|nr:preprotein translocase subunit SecG [Methylocaldum szegediense]CAI8954517.1 Protein-export membrane protein SecG [Methylocaldum szegediense]
MYQALTIIHVLVALAIIGLVLLQQGRGADAGAGFGGGASSSLFGARGAASFLSRTTAILATLFFMTSLSLAYLADKQDNKQVDIIDGPSVDPSRRDLPQVAEEPPATDKADLPESADAPQSPEPAK